MQRGVVEGIFVSATARVEPAPVEYVSAVAGRGLRGDRYFAAEGTFSGQGGTGRDLTLIEAEALEALERELDIRLAPSAARRNVLTRGVALNDLVGRRFSIGDVECVGRRLCEPCSHLEQLTEDGVLRGLAGRGGLRADVLSGGVISVGAPLAELGSGPAPA